MRVDLANEFADGHAWFSSFSRNRIWGTMPALTVDGAIQSRRRSDGCTVHPSLRRRDLATATIADQKKTDHRRPDMNVRPTVALESIHVHNARHEAIFPFRSVLPMEPVLTIFLKIINREIPADIVYEDDCCLAFRDVNPQAPVHVLLIPKKPVVSLRELTPNDTDLCAHLLLTVPKVADVLGLEGGYRTVVNTGEDGGQSVFHLHIHILGGRQLTWPPG